jgi:hypothetical protein
METVVQLPPVKENDDEWKTLLVDSAESEMWI